MRDINLLPETLQEKQKKTRFRFLANTGSVIFLIFISIVMAVVFFYRSYLTQTLNVPAKNQSEAENEIAQFREEEGLYRFLGLKLTSLNQNLQERKTYGAKIGKIREVFANTANLTKISMEKDKVSLAGEAVSFPDLAAKLSSLEKIKLFETFEITGLEINKERGRVDFTIQGNLE